MKCVDSRVSITENHMIKLVAELKRLELIMESERLKLRDVEQETLQFRRPKK